MWPVGRRYTWSEECEGVIVYSIVPEGDVLVAVQLAITMKFVHCDDSLGAASIILYYNFAKVIASSFLVGKHSAPF